MRILYKKTICLPRLILNVGRQFCKGFPKLVGDVGVHKVSGFNFLVFFALCSARASSANWDNRSLDLANSFAQRCSECNSSRIHATNSFCSAGGSFSISAKANSNLVISFSLLVSNYSTFDPHRPLRGEPPPT